MKSKLASFMLVLFMLTALLYTPLQSPMTAHAITTPAKSNIHAVSIGGSEVLTTSTSGEFWLDQNSRTQAPLRLLGEKLKCTVTWDNVAKMAILVSEDKTVTIKAPIGQNYILVNGKTVTMDCTSVIKGGRTYVPLRYIAEGMKLQVNVSTASTGKLNINIIDTQKHLSSIKITEKPDKLAYYEGDSLDTSGGVIKAYYSDNTTDTIKITSSMVSGFSSKSSGTKTVTVTYNGKTTTYTVSVLDVKVSSISIKSMPTKTTYTQSTDSLDLSGCTMTVKYTDGTSKTEDVKSSMITGFSNSTVGTKTLTVTYNSKTTTFTVKVVAAPTTPSNPSSSVVTSSIAMKTLPTKLFYIKDIDSLDLAGAYITITKSNSSTTNVAVTNSMVTGFSNTTIGAKTLTVTYDGKTTTFDINVIDKPVSSITLTSPPTKNTYVQASESLDTTGCTVLVSYTDSSTEVVNVTQSMCTDYDNTVLGSQNVVITYGGKTATFAVNIIPKTAIGISVSTAPLKLSYIQNYETLDVSGGVLHVNYNDATSTSVALNDGMCSGFSNATLGTSIVTVEYSELSTTFNTTIIPKTVTAIVMSNAPSKTTYVKDIDNLDTTGGRISVTYIDNSTEYIDITPAMCSGFDNSVTGSQTLTVTYEDKTCVFGIYIA